MARVQMMMSRKVRKEGSQSESYCTGVLEEIEEITAGGICLFLRVTPIW